MDWDGWYNRMRVLVKSTAVKAPSSLLTLSNVLYLSQRHYGDLQVRILTYAMDNVWLSGLCITIKCTASVHIMMFGSREVSTDGRWSWLLKTLLQHKYGLKAAWSVTSMNTSDCIPGEELTNFTCLTRDERVGLFVRAILGRLVACLNIALGCHTRPPRLPICGFLALV